jgi:hypothetical protein
MLSKVQANEVVQALDAGITDPDYKIGRTCLAFRQQVLRFKIPQAFYCFPVNAFDALDCNSEIATKNASQMQSFRQHTKS